MENNEKSKAGIVLDVLFWIDAIAIIAFAVTFPIDGFSKILWKIIVMAVLIVALFVFAVVGFEVKRKFRNKALSTYVFLRNIQIEQGKGFILRNGVELTKEDVEKAQNEEKTGPATVALLHIDQVEANQTTIRLFKEEVPLTDVSYYVNKN